MYAIAWHKLIFRGCVLMPLTIQKNNKKILYAAQFEELVYCISFFQYPWIRGITSPGNLIEMHVLKP